MCLHVASSGQASSQPGYLLHMHYVHDLSHMYIGLQEKVTVGESAPGGSAAAEGGGGGQGASVKYLSSRWGRQLL